MPGILNYQRYLNTLQTLTELGNTFPRDQTTYTFRVGSSGVDGWTATITWATLIIDQYTENSQGQPDFQNSQVVGYYSGGTTSQYTTGVLSLPSLMYTGPILPASLINLPITVVTIGWEKDGETYDVNLALRQNWEPGVVIGDPTSTIDFEPIEPVYSVLELSGPSRVIYGNTATFVAVSDIPISLGSPNFAYLKTQAGTLIGTTTFIDHTATWNVDNLSTGSYIIYAEFGGIAQYASTQSNTVTLAVVSGIPLIRDSESFTPSQANYVIGDTLSYSIRVIPDPSFTPSGYQVTTTNTIISRNSWTPNSEFTVHADRFYQGTTTATFSITQAMVDLSLASTLTNYSIVSYSTNTTLYTATIEVINTNSLITSWDYQTDGDYDSGSVSTPITVRGQTLITLTQNSFPLSISQNINRTQLGQTVLFTVSTTNTGYSNLITIYGQEASTTTAISLYSTNSSLTTSFQASINTLTTGTWTIYAAYPGDIGSSIYWANKASSSTAITHLVTDGQILDANFDFFRTATSDRLVVTGTTSTTLTNFVSFYNDSTFLGTATWIRLVYTTTSTTQITPQRNYWPAMPGVIHRVNTYTGVLAAMSAPGTSINTVSNITYLGEYTTEFISATGNSTYSHTPVGADSQITWPNALTTFEQTAATQNLRTWYNLYGLRYSDSYASQLIQNGDGSFTLGPIFDPVTPTSNGPQLYNSVANTRLQNRRGQNDGEINPNLWRLWRYYDGTNYNLTATNAFLNLLDPINTGTWQAQFLRSYNFGSGDVIVDNATTFRNFAYNSRIYEFDQGTDYGWDMYDVYRMDYLGDSRGYNVIGLNAGMTDQRPSTPVRLYFKASTSVYSWRNQNWNAQDLNTYYIDLVEYLGELNITNPIRNSTEYANGYASSTSTVWLYRFTPEVRASDNLHKTTMPLSERLGALPANTYQLNGRANRIPMTHDGIFRMPNGATQLANQYVKSEIFWQAAQRDNEAYGLKQWNSRNVNDPSENSYTDFCNAWFSCFATSLWAGWGGNSQNSINYSNKNYYYNYKNLQSSYSNYGTIYTAAQVSTSTITTVTNIWTATLDLALGTIDIDRNQRSEWPGTKMLDPIYGRFEPFTYIINTSTLFQAFEHFYDPNYKTISVNYPATRTSTFKDIWLRTRIPNGISGSVVIKNTVTNQTIATGSISNQEFWFSITADTLLASAGTSTISLASTFTDSQTARTITSPSLQIVATRYGGPRTTKTGGSILDTSLGNPINTVSTSWRTNSEVWTVNGSLAVYLPPLRYDPTTYSGWSARYDVYFYQIGTYQWRNQVLYPGWTGGPATYIGKSLGLASQTYNIYDFSDQATVTLNLSNFTWTIPEQMGWLAAPNWEYRLVAQPTITCWIQIVLFNPSTGQAEFPNFGGPIGFQNQITMI